MTIKDSHRPWNILSASELSKTPEIAKMLKPFSQPVTDCYECGVLAPTLSGEKKVTKDINVAGLFLKRALNDLRATWHLLLLGYTSQAGAVAAAAYENTLIVNCVAGSAERTEKLLKHKSGGSPWSVAELCKICAQESRQENMKEEVSSAHPENASHWEWEHLYAFYMWLCKLKHPTMPSAIHDALSVSPDGVTWGIMASPDARLEDLPSKAFILFLIIDRISEAIKSFAYALELDYKKPDVVSWQKRLDSVTTNFIKAMKPVMEMPLPFDYKGRVLKKINKEVS